MFFYEQNIINPNDIGETGPRVIAWHLFMHFLPLAPELPQWYRFAADMKLQHAGEYLSSKCYYGVRIIYIQTTTSSNQPTGRPANQQPTTNNRTLYNDGCQIYQLLFLEVAVHYSSIGRHFWMYSCDSLR